MAWMVPYSPRARIGTALRPAAALCAAAFLALAPLPAGAHPHIWVSSVTTFIFEAGKVTTLRMRWTFDDLFSAALIDDFDVNRDKALVADEIEQLRLGAFENLKEVSYFTDFRRDGELVKFNEARDFTAAIKDGLVVYTFTLVLPEPVDPKEVPVAVSVYDSSFYVEVAFDEHDPARFEGAADGCEFVLGEDRLNPIYYGLVFPRQIQLRCAKS